MNRDLEEQLDEMGPAYRAVVARLRAAREAGEDLRHKSYLTAASVLVLLALAVVLIQPHGRTAARPNVPANGPREYRATVAEMIATQNADGSWKNDFLTRRNAEALRPCSDPAARIAYKKAIRNLRSKGVL